MTFSKNVSFRTISLQTKIFYQIGCPDVESLHDVDDHGEDVAGHEDDDDDHQHDRQVLLILLLAFPSDKNQVFRSYTSFTENNFH